MEDNWEALRDKSLLQLTLPGSHNSGNVRQWLGQGPKCASDDKYAAYQAQGGALAQEDFDPLFLPWQVNHDAGIGVQLLSGIRFFHLKLCWLRAGTGEALALADVRHQHRGFTADTAESIVGTMATFLQQHRREVLAIGVNNLNQFGSADKATLAQLMLDAFAAAGISAIGPDRLPTATLAELGVARVALFFGGADELPPSVNPSATTLYERWDDRMESGEPSDAAAWLREDVAQYATTRGRFYVLQANPNNAMAGMFASVDGAAAAAADFFGAGPPQPYGESTNSLRSWESGFLRGLGTLVRQSLADNPTAQINAISTDFLELSGVTELALEVGGLPLADEDIGATLWDAVLTACVRPTTVDGIRINAFDYSQLTGGDTPAKAAFEQFIAFLAELPAIDQFSPRARKALLINAYNALAVKVIVDGFDFDSMASIKDVGGTFSPVWTAVAGTLAGQEVSLDDVEKGKSAPLVGLLPSYRDPRVHSSVICASVSCPDLSPTAFTPANVERLLDERVAAWLAHPDKGLSVDAGGEQFTASKIFDWYRADFDAWVPADGVGEPGFRGFMQRYAPPDVASQLRQMTPSAFEQSAVSYFDYDWNLNRAIPWWGSTNGLTGAPRDDFSLFMLRLQWAPEWCCGTTRDYCAQDGDEGLSNRLLIHGLWPQWDDADGDRSAVGVDGEALHSLYWPQYCDGGAGHDFSACCELQPGGGCHDSPADMCRLSPPPSSAALSRDMPDYINQPESGFRLGDHEWMKHGSCSAMDSDEYIAAALSAFQTLRDGSTSAGLELLTAAAGLPPSLTADHLQLAFAPPAPAPPADKMTALACNDDGRLVAVSTCWERLADGRVGDRVACPDNVLLERYSNSCIEQELVGLRSAAQMRADPDCAPGAGHSGHAAPSPAPKESACRPWTSACAEPCDRTDDMAQCPPPEGEPAGCDDDCSECCPCDGTWPHSDCRDSYYTLCIICIAKWAALLLALGAVGCCVLLGCARKRLLAGKGGSDAPDASIYAAGAGAVSTI